MQRLSKFSVIKKQNIHVNKLISTIPQSFARWFSIATMILLVTPLFFVFSKVAFADKYSIGSFWDGNQVQDRISACGSQDLAALSQLNLQWQWRFITDRKNNNYFNTGKGELLIGINDDPALTGYLEVRILKKTKDGAWGDAENAYRKLCDDLVKSDKFYFTFQEKVGSKIENTGGGTMFYREPGVYSFKFVVPKLASQNLGSAVALKTTVQMDQGKARSLSSFEWSKIGTTVAEGGKEPTVTLDDTQYPNAHSGAPSSTEPPPDAMPEAVSSAEGSPTESNQPGIFETILNWIAWIVAAVVRLINQIIYFLFSVFVVPVISALLSVQPWRDNFVNVIYPGWLIIRNLANVAFIISLLIIGLRVLFQVEDAAKSRSFIINLIIMALLVNFSLVIAQGAVAIADTVQSQFLPKDSKVIEAIGEKLMVDPAYQFAQRSNTETRGIGGAAGDIMFPIVLLFLSVSSFFAFIAIAAFIFIRIAALWVLYMVSPIAYFGAVIGSALGNAIPQASNISKQWWTEFMRYVLIVPILAFFLNMTALVAIVFTAREGVNIPVLGDSTSVLQSTASVLVQAALTIMTHFIVLIFLFLGMKYAQQSGVVGANTIVDFAQKGAKGTMSAIGKGAKNLGLGAKNMAGGAIAGSLESKGQKGLADFTRGLFRPKQAAELAIEKGKKKFEEKVTKPMRQKEKEERLKLQTAFDKDKPHINEVNDHAKEKNLAEKEVFELQSELSKSAGQRDAIGVVAVAQELIKQGHTDELIDKGKSDIADELRKQNKSEKEIEEELKKIEHNGEGLQTVMQHYQKQAGITDADLNKIVYKTARQQAEKNDRDEYKDVGLPADQAEGNKARRSSEQLKRSVVSVVEKGNVNNTINIDKSTGKVSDFKESHAKNIALSSHISLKDAGALSKLREQPHFAANQAAYNNKGRQQVIDAMDKEVKEGRLTKEEKMDRLQTLDNAFFYDDSKDIEAKEAEHWAKEGVSTVPESVDEEPPAPTEPIEPSVRFINVPTETPEQD